MQHCGSKVTRRDDAANANVRFVSGNGRVRALLMAVWFALRGGSFQRDPKSFTEGSKNVRHLPCYLSIQRDPEFFSAYHH